MHGCMIAGEDMHMGCTWGLKWLSFVVAGSVCLRFCVWSLFVQRDWVPLAAVDCALSDSGLWSGAACYWSNPSVAAGLWVVWVLFPPSVRAAFGQKPLSAAWLAAYAALHTARPMTDCHNPGWLGLCSTDLTMLHALFGALPRGVF
jgi:hypothetical protein